MELGILFYIVHIFTNPSWDLLNECSVSPGVILTCLFTRIFIKCLIADIEKIMGVDDVWFLGDNFLGSSFRENYKLLLPSSSFYKQSFEATAYCGSRFASKNTNMLSRIQHAICSALNTNNKLPKFIVVVLDTDLCEFLSYSQFRLSSLLGSWIKWIAKEINAAIYKKKSVLPKKALRPHEPFIYWVAAPFHNQFGKENKSVWLKFNTCLESVVKLYDLMRLMRLKEFWSSRDRALVNELNGRITIEGLAIYWKAINAAIEFNAAKHEEFLARVKFNEKKNLEVNESKNSKLPVTKDGMKRFFN